jgi:hypothetical protein
VFLERVGRGFNPAGRDEEVNVGNGPLRKIVFINGKQERGAFDDYGIYAAGFKDSDDGRGFREERDVSPRDCGFGRGYHCGAPL